MELNTTREPHQLFAFFFWEELVWFYGMQRVTDFQRNIVHGDGLVDLNGFMVVMVAVTDGCFL